MVAAPYGFVSANEVVVFQFNAAGQIQPNFPAIAAQLYSNAELNPQNSNGLGTYYLVTFYDQNGARLNKQALWWQFPQAAGATVDISTMTPFATTGGNVIFYPFFGSGSGTGTVASVTFTGDGTLLSSVPSAPVTTTGTLTASLLTQGANKIFAGPVTGVAAAPTFRTLVAADLPVTSTLALTVVSYSSTPTFNAALAQFFQITLTGNVTAPVLTGAVAGELLIFQIIEDAGGGHTFVWPTNVKGGMGISTTASKVNTQMFIFDGTNARAIAPGTIT